MAPTDKQDRPYDLVLLGATGFTGGLTADYLAANAPDAIGEGSIFQVLPPRGNCDPTRAATAHDAMVVGLADGSVRTLSPSMSGAVWWAAATPTDGETLRLD